MVVPLDARLDGGPRDAQPVLALPCRQQAKTLGGKKGGSVSQSVRPPANATAQARHIAEMAIEQRGSQCQRPPACLTEEDWPGLESVQLVDLAVVGQVGDEVVHVVLPRFVPAGG